MVKRMFTLLFFLMSVSLLSQNLKSVRKGFITIVTNQRIAFNDLHAEEDKVIFYNTETKSEFTYFLNSVKLIQDEAGNILFKSEPVPIPAPVKNYSSEQPTPQPKQKKLLTFINGSKILDGNKRLSNMEIRELFSKQGKLLQTYNSGKTLSHVGEFTAGFGTGLILGGAISNLIIAKRNSQTVHSEPEGSPAIIVTGLVLTVVSIPILLIGRKQIKKSVESYNERRTVMVRSCEIYLCAEITRFGVMIEF